MEKIKELYKQFSTSTGVCTDSRKLNKGEIFFALKGDNFDGNKYASKCLDQGAILAVVDDKSLSGRPNMFFVQDVLKSLQELANYHRRQFAIPFLGITGSNGKTTSKELIREVISKKYRTLATEGNFNNHIGVPLTLLKVNSTHEFAIIEMGANHVGEIKALCEIAEPNYGLITNIGEAHLEGFGGIEGVIQAKTELYQHLKRNENLAFVNRDDELLFSKSTNLKTHFYGSKTDFSYSGFEEGGFCGIAWNEQSAISQLVGKYNQTNLGAAAAIGSYFKVKDEEIAIAIREYEPGNHRSQLKKTESNELILDTYNANPSSMAAAVSEFHKRLGDEKLLILGDMFELGDYSKQKHAQIVEQIRSLNLPAIFVGEHFHEVAGHYPAFKTTANLASYLTDNPVRDKVILLKGSRGMALEQLEDFL